MNVVSRTLLIAFLLVAITQRAHATCQTDTSVYPWMYEEILTDTKFSGNCADWVKTGSATRMQVGSNWLVEFDGTGTLTQTQTAGTYTNGMSAYFVVYVIAGTPGTERLHAQILQGSTVVETMDVISPADSSGGSEYPIGDYSNTEFSVRFKFEPGMSPGTTKFRVDNVQVWGFF